MSFQNNVLWMPKEDGRLTDGEMSYDVVSKNDPKRRPQWFMDGEAALFPTKKQALEVSSGSLFDGIPASNLPPWGNVSGFCSEQSQITEQLFDNDASKDSSFHERNMASMNTGSLQMGRNIIDDPFESNALFGLSMSHSLEDPKSGVNYDGIRKCKVSEVGDPENLLSMPAGSSFTGEANNRMSSAHVDGKVDGRGISTSLSYDQEQDNVASLGHSYARENETFVSMDQSYINNACDAFAMGNPYKPDGSTIQMTNSFSETDCNVMQMAGQISKKGDNDITSIRHTYKGDMSVTSTQDYNKGDSHTTEIAPSNSNCERYALSMGQSFSKGEGSIICFGGNNDDGTDDPGRLVCSYDLLIARPSVQRSSSSNHKDLDVSNGNAASVSAQVIASGVEGISRKKEDTKLTKKTPPNNFPSNVRSLLSTGILDEVPVKYIAWSREKELRGIIKGTGYLCGCQPCNFSKVINAYEFERHAGCKTKHPNNHIYFENGKTIYGIVQELRNTPQNMLFDVIQTITGSPINQKSFRLWKESFLAATRELQRIYGKDDRQHPSCSHPP